MTDRETLEKVASNCHDLIAIQQKQQETTALILRACCAQLRSPDSRKRREAIETLEQLAGVLEEK